MVEVSHADRRSASVFSILRIMLGCSYGLLMLDAFISARAKYFGMKSMSHSQSNAVQLNGTESSSFTPNFDALSNVDVGDPTNGDWKPSSTRVESDASHVNSLNGLIPPNWKHILFPKAWAKFTRVMSKWERKGGSIFVKKLFASYPQVNFEGAQLISATFSRGESLPFWKWWLFWDFWVVYNQILRRSQKMSMLAHLDEHMIDRFLQNLEEADVFTEWSPDLEREDRIKTPTFHEIPVEDNQLDILDPIENQTNGPDDEREALVDSEAIDVQYDEWGAEKDVKLEKGEDGERKSNAERFSTTKSGFFTRSSRGQTAASNVEDKGRPGATPAKRSWTPFAFGGKKGDNTGKSKWMSFTRTKTKNEYE